MTKREDPRRIATWDERRKLLTVWVSPQLFGEREAATEEEATRIVEETGVVQTLLIERYNPIGSTRVLTDKVMTVGDLRVEAKKIRRRK